MIYNSEKGYRMKDFNIYYNVNMRFWENNITIYYNQTHRRRIEQKTT